MDMHQAILDIEKEWDIPLGCLGRLRSGEFDRDGFLRLKNILNSIQVHEDMVFERRFISLTWYIPLFMSWQIDRVAKNGGDTEELKKSIDQLENALENLLGTP